MLTYNMDARGRMAKYDYLYQSIKEDILEGAIRPGERLPSKRALAEHLGLSVVTVDAAYQQLVEEGYLYARERSGYYAYQLDCHQAGEKAAGGRIKLIQEEEVAARSGKEPVFQYASMLKIMREVIAEYGERLLERPPHLGCAELRNAIAEFLLRYRGMVAQPEQIVIGSGSEYLYGSVVQLLGREKIYGLEYPSYEKIRLVYEANGATCELLALDHTGIATESLTDTAASVLHITPFHSYPSGVTASAAKRYEYLTWAQKRGAIIVEDDFDSEFSLHKRPIETVYARDTTGSVIYINTFSHSLAPSMRVGYMILPPELMRLYNQKLGFYACSVPLFDQYILAKFIAEGHFERHLNRVRRQLRRAADADA